MRVGTCGLADVGFPTAKVRERPLEFYQRMLRPGRQNCMLVGSDEIFNIVFTVFYSLFQWANKQKRQHGQ